MTKFLSVVTITPALRFVSFPTSLLLLSVSVRDHIETTWTVCRYRGSTRYPPTAAAMYVGTYPMMTSVGMFIGTLEVPCPQLWKLIEEIFFFSSSNEVRAAQPLKLHKNSLHKKIPKRTAAAGLADVLAAGCSISPVNCCNGGRSPQPSRGMVSVKGFHERIVSGHCHLTTCCFLWQVV